MAMIYVNKMDKYFEAENVVSEIDLLVEADENLLVVDATKKMTRADRYRKTSKAKNRRKALYSRYGEVSNYAHRNWYDHDPMVNVSPVFAGNDEPVAYIKKGKKPSWEKAMKKVENRKVRYETFAEPMPEEVQTTGVTIDDDGEEFWHLYVKDVPVDVSLSYTHWNVFYEWKRNEQNRLLFEEFDLTMDVKLAKQKLELAQLQLEIAELKLKTFKLRNNR